MLVPSAESVAAPTLAKRSRGCRIFVSSPEAATTGRKKPKFSAAEIMDIQLQALVSRKLTGHHSLEFKIYTPKGNLYQSMTRPFDADAPIAEGTPRETQRGRRKAPPAHERGGNPLAAFFGPCRGLRVRPSWVNQTQ